MLSIMAKKKVSRMGRPPKKASERKSKRFEFRLTLDEYNQLFQDATKTGCSPTDLLRQCWLEWRGE
ncbi:hypothetical protein ACFL6U_18410 [Planctomycetota bacterium]